jgi:hypothetical protein
MTDRGAAARSRASAPGQAVVPIAEKAADSPLHRNLATYNGDGNYSSNTNSVLEVVHRATPGPPTISNIPSGAIYGTSFVPAPSAPSATGRRRRRPSLPPSAPPRALRSPSLVSARAPSMSQTGAIGQLRGQLRRIAAKLQRRPGDALLAGGHQHPDRGHGVRHLRRLRVDLG